MLGALRAIRINSDWKTADYDITVLDDVVLATATVPEPEGAWLMARGLPLLAWRRLRPAR